MNSYIVKGNKMLSGEIKISGSKNSLLPILVGACISKSISVIDNIPPLEDTYSMIEVLRHLNVNVIYDNKNKIIIDSRNIKNKRLDISVISKFRASYYFIGGLLSLFNKVIIKPPGGCEFMNRPIDLHLKAFSDLGVDYKIENGLYVFEKNNLKANKITFNKMSVGATINIILYLASSKEKVIINNAASEPEVDDLIKFLNSCGANIKRENTRIIVEGTNRLHGCNYSIIDDRIEAQTFLVIGALVGRNLRITYKNKEHISALISLFEKLNIDIKEISNGYIINKNNNIKNINVDFDVYPNLPTDIQPILAILFTKSKEESVFRDHIYPLRFSQVNELVMMGFNVKVEENKLIIRKNNSYRDSSVECKDLRGGASLVVGSLLSDKETRIQNIRHIKRGYDSFCDKLKKVGANIEEV